MSQMEAEMGALRERNALLEREAALHRANCPIYRQQ